jgi:uncharacterized Fe-S cluster-containing radical SAM superfamily protein
MPTSSTILRTIVADVEARAGAAEAGALMRHAASLAGAGAAPAKVIDEVLLLMLHRGESHALKSGAGVSDSLGVRDIARTYRRYPAMMSEAGEDPATPSSRRKNLQVMVTRRCNQRCTYCPVLKADRDMDETVLRHALRQLLATGEKDARLDFTGGEPLYRFDLVRTICLEGLELAAAADRRLSFYMVTNGTMMDRATARHLAGLPIMLEISMDGAERAHNRCKHAVEASLNPYRETRRAVDLLIEEGVAFHVVMVATPETAPSLGRSFDHVVSTGVGSVDINYAIGSLWTRGALDVFLDEIEGLLGRHGDAIASGRLALGNLGRRVEPAILNAERMVDTDGTLHLMTEWAFQTSFPEGGGTPSFGSVMDPGGLAGIIADRFHAYLTLLENAGWRDAATRRIVHNNIEVGRRVGEWFSRRGRP